MYVKAIVLLFLKIGNSILKSTFLCFENNKIFLKYFLQLFWATFFRNFCYTSLICISKSRFYRKHRFWENNIFLKISYKHFYTPFMIIY